MRGICDACGMEFDPHWRKPSEPLTRQGFCTRCHALWMEYMVQVLTRRVPSPPEGPGFRSVEMIPYLRGEKPLLEGMHFDVVIEESVREAVRRAIHSAEDEG